MSDLPTPTTTSARLGRREWAVLLVLCGAIFLEGSDIAMITIALPSIRADLGLATSELSGLVTAYVVGYGGFMLLGGRAADVYGRRRMFLIWLTVFLVFSGVGGFATEGWMLLVSRLVTGIAAGFLTPAGLSLVTTEFPEGPRRNRALVIYGAAGAAGFSLGLVAGGLLSAVHWRWVFFFPVVLTALLLVLAATTIRRDPPAVGRDRLHVGSALTVTAAMVLTAWGIVRLEHPGDGLALTIAALLGGLALGAVFVQMQRRTRHPLLRLGLLRTGMLARANVAAVGFAAAFYGFQLLLTLFLQELRGWSALTTALVMLLMAIDAILAPTITPRLIERFGVARVVVGGTVALLAGIMIFVFARLDWGYALMAPSMALVGVAFALAYGPLAIAATDGVAEQEQGVAGGLLNTSFQFGAAVGISAATVVYTLALGAATSDAAALQAFHLALLAPAAFTLVAAAAMGIAGRRAIVTSDAGVASDDDDPADTRPGAPVGV